MPRSKKKKAENKSVAKSPTSKATNKAQKGRWTGFIIASVVIALILAIVGVGYYLSGDAKYRRLAIITVDGTPIRMDYFLKRSRLAGADPMSMLETLANEQLIQKAAPRYVGNIAPDDIMWELRRMASGGSENVSETEFKEWYRQQLNESRLSDSEYKELAAVSLLATRLNDYLATRMPKVAEQVHLYGILVKTPDDAQRVRARWAAGKDFADLAREVSLDEESKKKGGELGWFPHGILPTNFDEAAFSLGTNNVSEPIPLMGETTTEQGEPTQTIIGYYLLMVSEKGAREVNKDYLPALADKAFGNWLLEEMKSHEIKYNFNSEISAWINWQLSKK